MKKKTYFLLLSLLFCIVNGQGFSPKENYIYTRVFLDSVTAGSNLNAAQSVQTVRYTDGLGRPKQNISINAVKPNQDLVTAYFYEDDGRQTKQYLPVSAPSQNGVLHGIDEAAINAYYGTANAYSEVAFDGSPLNQVVKKASPGNDWAINSGNTQEFFYEFNEGNTVKKYVANLNTTTFENSLEDHGYYPINTLFKNTVKDEDGNISSVYKDGLGKTIMSRVINGNEYLDTYYVYNQYGQQVFVIPPLNNDENIFDENVRGKIAYQYRYDAYGRMIEKKIPGRSWEYYVYDKENRVIMSTDGKLKSEGKWSFVKYDRFGRTIYTGLCTGGERTSEQNNAELATLLFENHTGISPGFTTPGTDVYYTKNAYPTAVTEVLTINYYDEYPNFATAPRPQSIYSQPTLAPNFAENHSTKSLLTASFVRNIENTAWSRTFFWYDTKERLIGNHNINSMNGHTRTEMKLDFPGNITHSKVMHARDTIEPKVVVTQRYVYSPQNLLERHYHQVDNKPEELLAAMTYDDLGRITSKTVGNGLQTINYSYNIRGWLTAINNPDDLGADLFGFRIGFNQREGEMVPNSEYPHLQVKPKFNGSIAETYWATPEKTGRYGYVYDRSGRMLAGLYQHPSNPFLKEHTEIVDYDRRGNISHLKRTSYKFKGPVQLIDDLIYTYDGNQLSNLNDLSQNRNGAPHTGIAIGYDINGNMTAMAEKGITQIRYNFLNLPSNMNTSSGNTANIYTAAGTKIKKTFTLPYNGQQVDIVTEYLDGFQYSTPNTGLVAAALESGDEAVVEIKTATEPEAFSVGERIPIKDPPNATAIPELAFFPTSEGYYDYRQNRYIYQYKDHLGNVRVSYVRNSEGVAEIIDRNDYYAFGMNHLSPSGGTAVYDPLAGSYKYKYNGKELQETGMYDYGWRMYMPDIARWNGIDQLAEKFNSFSPYAYVMNNPVMFFDPDGRDVNFTDWMDKLWKSASSNAITTYSNFDSFGNWGSRTHSFFEVAGTATQFYNFLAGGGTGYYTYWTNNYTANPGGYAYDGHAIYIKGNSDCFLDNIFSNTTTIGQSFEIPIYDFWGGDKSSIIESSSETFGKASGLINVDTSFNNNSFDGISFFHKLGTSISFKADGTKEIGQTIGDYEFHIGSGPGIGLGQYNIGYKYNTGSKSLGRDFVLRPGFGSLVAASVVVGTIIAPEIVIPIIPALIK